MNAQKILFPTDFSPPSETALALASSLARERGAMLYIIHIEDNPAPYGPGLYGPGPYGQVPSPVAVDGHRLARTLPTATEVTFQHDLLLGDPAQEIVRFAREKQIDLIVMGSHGRTGLKRALAGSVAEAVMRQTTVPVLTVNSSAQQLAESISRPRSDTAI